MARPKRNPELEGVKRTQSYRLEPSLISRVRLECWESKITATEFITKAIRNELERCETARVIAKRKAKVEAELKEAAERYGSGPVV